MPRKKLTVSIAILFVAFVCASGMAGCASQSTPQSPQQSTPLSSSSGASQATTPGGTASQGAPKSGNMIGTWSVSMGSAAGPTWQFLDGGKLTETLPLMKGGTQNLQGTYALSGNSMTVTTQGNGGTTITGTVTWVSPDEFQYGLGGGTLTFVRKK